MTKNQNPTTKIRKIRPGRSFPLGATVQHGATNFCVFSRNCTKVELLLFDKVDSEPTEVIELNPEINRTFYYWHILLDGITHGQLYGWRVHGPFEPKAGLFFRGDKLLVDPYARAVATPESYHPSLAVQDGDNSNTMMKSVVVNPDLYDWGDDQPPLVLPGQTVIYEMHVAGFTKHESSRLDESIRGSYRGVIEKIPYLKSLGVNAVELLPVQQFDKYNLHINQVNYWGYNPVAFFAPHNEYATKSANYVAVVDEFRDMVKALHQANIRVILDVVYNHTAEGDETGPTLSLRGFENRAYYIPHPEDRGRYADYSGCGNTINGNQSIVRRLILDSLRYWVSEMHIDAFRFDLASVLARDEWGEPLKSPPILWEIESDPVLAGTQIIAEAWDAAGLYQVGSFVGHRWSEWNGRFRDDVRRFVRGDKATVEPLTHRITGSTDLYSDSSRDIERSINFITAHDGFTLMDLVSYSNKHNEANGENNQDGANHNFSANWGVEGETNDPRILALRLKQIRNLLLLLMISQGTPMFWMGDEMGRTQNGNNNAYCQDNEIGWLNWSDLNRFPEIHRFLRKLILLRHSHSAWQVDSSWSEVRWSGVKLDQPDFADYSHTLAFTIESAQPRLHIMLNSFTEPLDFELPKPELMWYRLIDTSMSMGNDFKEGLLEAVKTDYFRVNQYSSVVLVDGFSVFPFQST